MLHPVVPPLSCLWRFSLSLLLRTTSCQPPVTMLFSKLVIAAFAGVVLAQKAPPLPNPAAAVVVAADGGVPVVASDRRGAEGDEDLSHPKLAPAEVVALEEAVVLEEAAKVVSTGGGGGDVMANEVARTKVGIRGAADGTQVESSGSGSCHTHYGTSCPGCGSKSCCDKHYESHHGSDFNCKWTGWRCGLSTTACGYSGSLVYVKYVKCIKPSSGTAGWVNDLIGVLTSVGVGLGGIAICAGTAGVGCAVVAVGASAGIDQLTKAAIKAGAPEALGTHFGGSEDDLYLSANGRKFSAEVEIGSQETKAMGAITWGLPKICLMEYDWGSGDDNMGCIETRKLGGVGHYGVVVASKEHGSVYEVELQIM